MKLGKPLAVGFAEEADEAVGTEEVPEEAVAVPVPEEAVPAGR
ncbi:hypothetical protein [Streptomyces caatingaensis]|nr:hypothetical protein [Streptomyces caatingaensis]